MLRVGRLRNRGSIFWQEVFLSSEAEAHPSSCMTGNNVAVSEAKAAGP